MNIALSALRTEEQVSSLKEVMTAKVMPIEAYDRIQQQRRLARRKTEDIKDLQFYNREEI